MRVAMIVNALRDTTPSATTSSFHLPHPFDVRFSMCIVRSKVQDPGRMGSGSGGDDCKTAFVTLTHRPGIAYEEWFNANMIP